MRTTIFDLAQMKAAKQPIAMVTAYDYSSAILAERAGLRLILVGDSLGMVVQGHSTTLPVRIDDMVRHASYVVRGTSQALVVADMPFLSYASVDEAVRSAGCLMQEAGVGAVKLEGGISSLPAVRRLVELGVPVMGHLGYTPQSTHQIGVRVQAKDVLGARALLADALALEAAGAFALVLELVPASLAAFVTERLAIPTIGIGAGAGCDGQVQVWHDLLGLSGGKVLRHAKRFCDAGNLIENALRTYAQEVGAGAFPGKEHSTPMSQDIFAELIASQG